MNPKNELENGANLLKCTMSDAGFNFIHENQGNSSGGNFAKGSFVLDDKKLELSFRYSLGCVEYKILNHSISHKDYMDAIGKKKESLYPGFSTKPIEAFEHLDSDISKYCKIFLQGSNQQFIELIELYRNKPKKLGFGALSSK